jgi:hypothetical protein
LVLARRQPGIRDSLLETRFVQLLRRSGVALPVPQFEVRDGSELIAVADFAYPDRRVLIELDGLEWHAGRAALDADLFRQNRLVRLGWKVLRFSWTHVNSRPSYVVSTVRAALRLAG